MAPKLSSRKYNANNLIPMFRRAAKLCVDMRTAGFTDNGGAIHSAERILNLLGLYLNYPDISHINNLRKYERAEFSREALDAYNRGEKVLIEHVAPVRAFTRKGIELCEEGATDAKLKKYVRDNYRLVLLTPDETQRLNKLNRSSMDKDRLSKAGILLASPRSGRGSRRP